MHNSKGYAIFFSIWCELNLKVCNNILLSFLVPSFCFSIQVNKFSAQKLLILPSSPTANCKNFPECTLQSVIKITLQKWPSRKSSTIPDQNSVMGFSHLFSRRRLNTLYSHHCLIYWTKAILTNLHCLTAFINSLSFFNSDFPEEVKFVFFSNTSQLSHTHYNKGNRADCLWSIKSTFSLFIDCVPFHCYLIQSFIVESSDESSHII